MNPTLHETYVPTWKAEPLKERLHACVTLLLIHDLLSPDETDKLRRLIDEKVKETNRAQT